MTGKERILTSMRGQEVDRLTFCPFLAYWWEHNKKPTDDSISFLRYIDADIFLRGSCFMYNVGRKNHTMRENTNGYTRTRTYSTKRGELTAEYTYSPLANSWFLVKHPVKTEADFRLLKNIFEDIELTANYQEFDNQFAKVGELGLVTPCIGIDYKTAFQAMVEYWMGTVELNYALCDFPDVVEDTLAVMQKVNTKAAEITFSHNNCDAVVFFEDSSTRNVSPTQFEKYALPEIESWTKTAHQAGKLLIHHACGDLKHLLPQIKKSGIDCLESISPPPTGDVELWDATKILGPDVSLAGGIEPTIFENYDKKSLTKYVENLLERMPARGFLVSNSDSCPPGVEEWKFRLVADIVKRWKV